MRKTLEDLYYGNITPNEQQMTPGSELKRAVDRVTNYHGRPVCAPWRSSFL